MKIGNQILRFKQIESTQNYLEFALRESDMQEGLVAVADFQTMGKGQRGNSWESEAGKNLTFSMVLKPDFLSVANAFQLNKVISISILELLLSLNFSNVKIKWPNDILIDDKKIGGILVSNQTQGNFIKTSIIGIGLNVNQTGFKAYKPRAASLKMFTGKDYDLGNILQLLLKKLEANYLKLKFNYGELAHSYLKNLYLIESWGFYEVNGKITKLKIKNVSSNGELILLNTKGHQFSFKFKEIKFQW